MNGRLKLVALAITSYCGVAHAGFITTGGIDGGNNGQLSTLSGACTVSFNNGTAGNSCGATYTGASPSNFPTGTTSTHASPAGDTTAYFAVGPADGASVTISLNQQANYFGFFTGSLDSYNLVQFYLNNVMVDAFTGTQINDVAFPGAATNGDQSSSAYVNYFPTSSGGTQTLFDRVVYSSTSNAFETDNHTFGQTTPEQLGRVPEPGSIALLGIAGLALFASRRRWPVAKVAKVDERR
jgi:hypothetical protein